MVMSTFAQTHLHEELQTSGYSTYQVVGVCVNIGFVCAGKSASFLATEPTPKQERDLLPRFLQVPWPSAGTGVSISGQVAIISLGAEAGGC